MKKLIVLFSSLAILACNPGKHDNQKGDQQDSAQAKIELNDQEESEPKLVSKEVTYTADGITMKGYMVYDDNIEGKRPAVVVVHEWWGHNQHTRHAADQLAKDGYIAFAVDMFGDGKQASHPKDAKAFSGEVMSNFTGAQKRFNAAMNILKANENADSNQTAAIGYCFGGGVVLNMARQGADLDAVATFHGSLGPINPAKKGDVKAKILVMNGEDDPFTQGAVEDFKAEMDQAGVDYEFVNYPGAKHSFTNPAATELGKEFNIPLEYNEKADQESWKKLQEFLKGVFENK